MNIEAYDADSLRKMVRLLEYENKILKDKLKKAGISYEEVNPFEEKIESAEEYDLDQGNRIVNPPYITESGCKKIIAHLLGTKEDGSDVIGVYPLLSNGTCRFIVFDFDNHKKGAEVTDFANTDNEWHKEVDALRKMCVPIFYIRAFH